MGTSLECWVILGVVGDEARVEGGLGRGHQQRVSEDSSFIEIASLQGLVYNLLTIHS